MPTFDKARLLELIQPIINQFVEMGTKALQFTPILILGLLFLLVFLFLAKIVRFVIRRTFRKLKFDILAEKVGISSLLAKFGVSAPLSQVLAAVIYWMITLFALKSAADIWGIADISNFINSVILFLPKLMVAVGILLGGLLAADLAKKALLGALNGIGFDYSNPIANSIYGLLAVMILTVVLGQLGIETELLNSAVKILLGSFALTVAISLGFGLRSIAKNVVSGVYARDIFPPGSILEIDDMMAVVREVGAVSTRLETSNDTFIVVPNSQLIGKVHRGKKRVSEKI